MEYERALFRVYERLLEGVSETGSTNSVNKTCRMFEYLVLTLGAILFICLVILHISFVGTGGCLPQLLKDYAILHQNSSFFNFSNDQILQIYLGDSFSPYAPRRLGYDVLNSTNRSSFAFLDIPQPDYEFAREWSVLSLDRSTRVNHNFELINITMSGEGCFGGPLQQLLLPLGGVGPVVANDVIYGIGGSGGGVLKAAHGQSYYWRRPPQPHSSMSISDWVAAKLSIIITTCLSFFVLSTTTALLVRVLISSGVVLLFPLFSCLQVRQATPLARVCNAVSCDNCQ
jgi:hypothetical protein